MPDRRLRELDRAWRLGDAGALEPLKAERERMGLCRDCGLEHREPVTTGCKGGAPIPEGTAVYLGGGGPMLTPPTTAYPEISHLRARPREVFELHATGTRALDCGACQFYARQKATPGYPVHRAAPGSALFSRAVIKMIAQADPCPARIVANLRKGKPYLPNGPGRGVANANAAWYAERKRFLSAGWERRLAATVAVVQDPKQRRMFDE